MRSSRQDKVESTYHEIKERPKGATGKLSDNPKIQATGMAEKIAGKTPSRVGLFTKVIR